MNKKVIVHTTILRSEKKILLEYGKGKLNAGITEILRQLKQKEYIIKIVDEFKV